MPKKTSSYRERLLEDLLDPQEAADYINAAIEDGSPEILLLALRHVAEAHKMSRVAKGTGVAREAIYRILSEKGNPRLSNLWNLFPTLGLEFFVRPKASKRKSRVHKERFAAQNTTPQLRQQMRLAFGNEHAIQKRSTVQPTSTATIRVYLDTSMFLGGNMLHSNALNLAENVPPAFVINEIATNEEIYAR